MTQPWPTPRASGTKVTSASADATRVILRGREEETMFRTGSSLMAGSRAVWFAALSIGGAGSQPSAASATASPPGMNCVETAYFKAHPHTRAGHGYARGSDGYARRDR